MKKNILLVISILLSATMYGQTKKEVLEVANRANDYFMAKWSDPTVPTNFKVVRPSNLWTRSVYYEGLLALYGQDPQQRFLDYVDKWAVFHKWGPYKGDMKTFDADYQCCAQIYCTRYFMEGGEEKYRTMQKNFDNQIASGNNRRWTWIDAIQMAMPAYAMMSRITEDRKYIDYAMRSYIWTRDTCGGRLFNTDEGLWWRDANFVAPYKESDGQNWYWSRGNGWVFTALCRVMDQLSPKDKYYKLLKDDYLMMAQALLKVQREDGFWNASLLCEENYGGKETTGTALFVYGLVWGVRNGLLTEKEYLAPALKAWKGMVDNCIRKNGSLGYVQGTGARPEDGQPATATSTPDFEDYGIGCFLLAASEVYKVSNPDGKVK